MEKFIKEYGVIFLLYFIIIFGVLVFCNRMHSLNMNASLASFVFAKGIY